MALKDKKSILDRNIKGVEGQPVGQNPPSKGSYFADAGTSDSPFDTVRGPKMDQMVQMLTNNVKSENSGQTYIPSPNKSPYQDLDGAEGPKFDTGKPSQVHGHPAQLPNPSELVEDYTSTVNPWANYGNSQWPVVPAVGQDLNGADGGQGYFHGMANPGKGQGKQINGVDLHEHLLTKAYKYSHGKAATEIVGPSPGETGNSDYQDLDGSDIGNGLFHNIYRPGKGQGKQIGRKDLHEHLLTKTYAYNHGGSNEVVGPSPGQTGNSEYQDLNSDGNDIGNGIFTIGKLQGKQLGGKDLHEALLTKAYTYSHGGGSRIGTTPVTIGPSPGSSGFSDFQDLDGGFASPNSNLGQFGGPYRTTGPTDGFY